MANRRSLGWVVLVSVLSVAWLIGTTGAANAEAPLESWNFKLLGTVDIADDGTPAQSRAYSKIAPWPDTVDTYFNTGCYENGLDQVGCFRVIDVKNPKKPKRIATVEVYDPVKSPRPPLPTDPFWNTYPHDNVWGAARWNDLPFKSPCGDWVPGGPGWTTGPKCWDKGWVTRTHFTAGASGDFQPPDCGPGCGAPNSSIIWVNSQRQSGAPGNRLGYTGVRFYDLENPYKPKLLGGIDMPVGRNLTTGVYTTAGGVHHGFFDGRYAYLGADYDGFVGRILVIVDAKDPKNPIEVGKWWLKGQKTPEEDADRYWNNQSNFNPITYAANGKINKGIGMHYVSVHKIHGKEIAILSYHQAGLVILDVTDKRNPIFISQFDYLTPEFQKDENQGVGPVSPSPDYEVCQSANKYPEKGAACGNAHSAKLVPGTNIVWMTDEYFNLPYGHLRLFDVSNLWKPKLLSHFLFDRSIVADPAGYAARAPSAHLGNTYNKDLLFMAWYGLGVKAINISNPKAPYLVGSYSYSVNDGVGGQGAYDVIFDPKGNLVVTDEADGARILKYTGPGSPLR